MIGIPNFMGFRGKGDIPIFVFPTRSYLYGWGDNTAGWLGASINSGYLASINYPAVLATDPDWKLIDTGYLHSLAIKRNNTLWGWGNNGSGQLGLSNTTSQSFPVMIGNTSDWAAIRCGRLHSIAIKTNGTLWSWGHNSNGQLGLGNTTSRSSPVQVGSDTNWQTSSAGEYFTIAIKTNGTLWSWGSNSNGQLGLGNTTQRSSPVQVGTGTTGDWSKISSGRYFAIALKNNGTLWAWGNNSNGELGLGNATNRSSPVQVGTGTTGDWSVISAGREHAAAIKTNGTLWTWGKNFHGQLGLNNFTARSSPVQVGSGATGDWENVCCLGYHTLALKTNGEIWSTGDNSKDQLGLKLDRQLSSPVQIGSGSTGDWASISKNGSYHTLAIKNNGTLWGWGRNTVFPINSSGYNVSSPIQIGSGTTGDWLKVSAAGDGSMALQTNGTLWAWGSNIGWQLGTPFNWPWVTSPIQVGSASGTTGNWSDFTLAGKHGLALRTDGTLWAWGNNSNGELGLGDTITRSSPVQVGSATDWQKVMSGNYASFAIKTNGTLWAWGNNSDGRLGLNDYTNRYSPVQVGPGTTGDWAKVFVKYKSTFAIKTNGTLWAWGQNSEGQLGLADTTHRSSPVQVGTGTTGDWLTLSENNDTGVGGSITLGIKTNGTLWAWGSQINGEMGLGDKLSRSSPVQVGTDTDWAYTPGGPSINALKTNGTLWGWGDLAFGTIGMDDRRKKITLQKIDVSENQSITGNQSIILPNDGIGKQSFIIRTIHPLSNHYSLFTWGRTNYNQGNLGNNDTGHESTPVRISSSKAWTFVSCGDYHSHAIKKNGTLWGWGANTNSQLGDGSGSNKSIPVQITNQTDWAKVSNGIRQTIGIKKGGAIFAWGRTINGVLGLSGKYNYVGASEQSRPKNLETGLTSNWSDVSVGTNHALAIKTNGTLWAWGLNYSGQLGQNNTTNTSSPVQVGTGITGDWTQVSAGNSFSMAIKTNGTLWAWGRNNNYGQLGQGNTTNTSSPVQVGNDTDWSTVDCHLAQHTLAMKTNGTLWAWGNGNYGNLGLMSTTSRSSPVQIGTDTNWEKVSSSVFNSFAKKSNGTVWSWGRNRFGSLGIGNNPDVNDIPIRTGTGTNWASAGSGINFGAAITTSGALWVWGSSTYGQLGLNNTTTVSSPVLVGTDTNWSTVNCSAYFMTAIKTDGTMWTWGRNSSGQLGLGNITSRSSPVQIGSDNNWQSIGSSQRASSMRAIKTTGTLWAWGSNSSGELGLGNTTNRSSPVQVGSDTDWSIVTSGSYHTLAIKTTGTLWAWGRNNNGQLGLGNTTSRSSPVQVGTDTNWSAIAGGSDFSFGIKTNGTLWGVGNNSVGQLGLGNTTSRSSPVQIGSDTNWSKINSGDSFTLAIKTNGTLWGWGVNNYGQLGIGNMTRMLSPVQIGNDNNWAAVRCGSRHSIAIKTDGSLWAWGDNTNGRTGTLILSSTSSPVQIGSSSNWDMISGGRYIAAAILKYKP